MNLSSQFYSTILWLLARTERIACKLRIRPLWSQLHKVYLHSKSPVKTRIHGKDLWVTPGYTYPITWHSNFLYNACLVELTLWTALEKNRPIRIIDIGAAVGDTAILLTAALPNQIDKLWCIEGDSEFFGILKRNTETDVRIHPLLCMLGEDNGHVGSLVKIHPGTASAIGNEIVNTQSLDSLAETHGIEPDLIKVDIDGFDGIALASAKRTLAQNHPHVVFEWHPILLKQCQNNIETPFKVLSEAGYKSFIWFQNAGSFSHFSPPPSSGDINQLADYLDRISETDSHYDIIALSPDSHISPVDIATLWKFKALRKARLL